MKKKVFLNLTGVLFLVLGISAVINTLYMNSKYDLGLASVLWFCYIGMILLGIGVLRRDNLLVLSQFNIIAFPLLVWNIDFYYQLFTGKTLFDVASYFFIPGPFVGKIITSQHLFSIPLALFAIYLIGLKNKDAWKLSFAELGIVFVVTRIATNPVDNINCVYTNCANFNIGFLPYWIEWFLAMFLLVFVTNWIVIKVFYRNS